MLGLLSLHLSLLSFYGSLNDFFAAKSPVLTVGKEMVGSHCTPFQSGIGVWYAYRLTGMLNIPPQQHGMIFMLGIVAMFHIGAGKFPKADRHINTGRTVCQMTLPDTHLYAHIFPRLAALYHHGKEFALLQSERVPDESNRHRRA